MTQPAPHLPQAALARMLRDLTDALMQSPTEKVWRQRAAALRLLLQANEPGWRSNFIAYNVGSRMDFLRTFAEAQESPALPATVR